MPCHALDTTNALPREKRIEAQNPHVRLHSLSSRLHVHLRTSSCRSYCNRTPAPKHVPHQNTLKISPIPPIKCAINSLNQVVSTRQWPQFKEESLLIMLMQLGSSSVTVALSPDESVALRSQRRKRTHSGTNALLSSKRSV
jgi:hypothetical protein